MDPLKNLARQALSVFRAFQADNPMAFKLLALAVALGATVCTAFYWFNPGAPVVLAGNLSPADRTALALRLRHRRIDFILGADSISVPSGELNAAQSLLQSGPGFPGGADDFGLFDQTPMGQSDFAEQVNYQRSLQGELERTIMDIHGIDNARVMLAMGHPSPFALGTNEFARASVMLTVAPGAVLDSTTAQAIAHLVASSLRGLSVDNVTITASDGALLFPPQRSGEIDEAMRLRNDFEHRLEEKASGLLTRIMGDNRFAVEVAVDVDTSRVSSKDTLYGKGDQAILSEEHSITPAANQVGGIPGLTSNLPTPSPSPQPRSAPNAVAATAPGHAATPIRIADQTQTNDQARKDIVNYRPSAREISTVTAPVRIKRITVAAVLDGTYDGGRFAPLSAERLAAVKSLLAAAVGADLGRGDQVDVQSAALSQPYVPPVPSPLEQVRIFLNNPIRLAELVGVGLVAIALLMWLLIRTISRAGRRRREARAVIRNAETAAPTVGSAAPVTGDNGAKREIPADAPAANPPSYEAIKARLNEEVNRDPAAAAETLRQWLELANANGTANGQLH
jgi:flagellar M-ring protein FliF